MTSVSSVLGGTLVGMQGRKADLKALAQNSYLTTHIQSQPIISTNKALSTCNPVLHKKLSYFWDYANKTHFNVQVLSESVTLPTVGIKRYTNSPYTHNFYNEPLICEHAWIYALNWATCGWVCVGVLEMGGALSVITISDWFRAKVCDISQPSTHSVAVETHLRVTLSSSPPPSLTLTLTLSSPPREFQRSCVSHAGCV